jgi:hypothetical protein
MKNVVFMMNVDLAKEGRFASSRTKPYKYSVDSWKRWCATNDCELFVLTEEIVDHDVMGICWQRWYIFDLLEANGIEYDQVLSVDADTIVHPECPNVFEMTDNKFTVVEFDGSWDWVLRSIESYSKYVFGDYMLKEWWKYFDSGFWIVNKSHKPFAKKFVEFYSRNSKLLIEMQDKFLTGTEQTPLNFMLDIENIDVKHLPYEFNMNDMNRKEILSEDLLFTKVGWIYQFNCIPNNTDNKLTDYWMKKAYNYFYGEYKE